MADRVNTNALYWDNDVNLSQLSFSNKAALMRHIQASEESQEFTKEFDAVMAQHKENFDPYFEIIEGHKENYEPPERLFKWPEASQKELVVDTDRKESKESSLSSQKDSKTSRSEEKSCEEAKFLLKNSETNRQASNLASKKHSDMFTDIFERTAKLISEMKSQIKSSSSSKTSNFCTNNQQRNLIETISKSSSTNAFSKYKEIKHEPVQENPSPKSVVVTEKPMKSTHLRCLSADTMTRFQNRRDSFGVPQHVLLTQNNSKESSFHVEINQPKRNLSSDQMLQSLRTMNHAQGERVASVLNRIFAENGEIGRINQQLIPQCYEEYNEPDTPTLKGQNSSLNFEQVSLEKMNKRKDSIEQEITEYGNSTKPQSSGTFKSLPKINSYSQATIEDPDCNPTSIKSPTEQIRTQKSDIMLKFNEKIREVAAAQNLDLESPKHRLISHYCPTSTPEGGTNSNGSASHNSVQSIVQAQLRLQEITNHSLRMSQKDNSSRRSYDSNRESSSEIRLEVREIEDKLSDESEIKRMVTPEFKENAGVINLIAVSSETSALKPCPKISPRAPVSSEPHTDRSKSPKRKARFLNFEILYTGTDETDAYDCNTSSVDLQHLEPQTLKEVQRQEAPTVTVEEVVQETPQESKKEQKGLLRSQRSKEHAPIKTRPINSKETNSRLSVQTSRHTHRVTTNSSKEFSANKAKCSTPISSRSLITMKQSTTPNKKPEQSSRATTPFNRQKNYEQSASKSNLSYSPCSKNNKTIESKRDRSGAMTDRPRSQLKKTSSNNKVKEVEVFLGGLSENSQNEAIMLTPKTDRQDTSSKIQRKKVQRHSSATTFMTLDTNRASESVQKMRSPTEKSLLTARTMETCESQRSVHPQSAVKLELVSYPTQQRKSTPMKEPRTSLSGCKNPHANSTAKKNRQELHPSSDSKIRAEYKIEPAQKARARHETITQASESTYKTESLITACSESKYFIQQFTNKFTGENHTTPYTPQQQQPQIHGLRDKYQKDLSSKLSSLKTSCLISPPQNNNENICDSKPHASPPLSIRNLAALGREIKAKSKELTKNSTLFVSKRKFP